MKRYFRGTKYRFEGQKKYKRVYKSWASMIAGKRYWKMKGYKCGKVYKYGRIYAFNCYK